jgi:hypothetical protein
MSKRAIGVCFYVLGVMLLMPAFAGIFIDSPVVHESCARYCWAFRLGTALFGATVTKVLNGIVWLFLSLLMFYMGYKVRHHADADEKS